jgi:hypothetical protein
MKMLKFWWLAHLCRPHSDRLIELEKNLGLSDSRHRNENSVYLEAKHGNIFRGSNPGSPACKASVMHSTEAAQCENKIKKVIHVA